MSDSPTFAQEPKKESAQLTSEGGVSMAPPAFQLKAGPVAQLAKDPDSTSYNEGKFEIANAAAVIRDKDAAWAAIKYKKGDADLPKKKVGDKEVADESFVGKDKTIPNGTKVDVDDVYIQKATTSAGQDTLLYAHCVGFGWTAVSNIKGGLKNESVGELQAAKPLSTDPSHYTVAVEKAVILQAGNRYPTRADNSVIPINTEITVEETFSGYYLNNAPQKLAKVTYAGNTVYTSTGNFSAKAHDKANPKKRKITVADANIRDAVPSYIPATGTLALGKHVVIGTPVEQTTGTYVEVFAAAKPEGSETYTKGDSLGWTNLLNLTQGFHTDLKGKNGMWDQVIPDGRYDRLRNDDTAGTAKFTGNDDMIQIVDSDGKIEYVSKLIWPSLKQMLDAANAAGINLQLNTGFRHWDYQVAMINAGYPANPVGFSNHQIGMAVDLNNRKEPSNTSGKNWWMERNAYKYGFVRTYATEDEGHHWEYRPAEVTQPVVVEKGGVKYMKYTFASYTSESTSMWNRSYVLDKIE
ncbi:MAG: D-alanyl-D-alanine carboxypeptidase family protein [Bacteroidetes bacterium]|nr:D-alanyl-D-alanine carboxypeptidase family protein [Bacteroidota bacterium]